MCLLIKFEGGLRHFTGRKMAHITGWKLVTNYGGREKKSG